MTQVESDQNFGGKNIGRNEPCPCGSGKKFKRCHGRKPEETRSQPHASDQSNAPGPGALDGNEASQFDPSQVDPAKMAEMARAIQRLPRGQVQRIQSLVQRAMAGKDVSREAEMLEKMLPPGFKQMMESFGPQSGEEQKAAKAPSQPPLETEQAEQAADDALVPGSMTLEEAKALVEKAAAKGEITEERAQELLESVKQQQPSETGQAEPGKLGRFWKGILGKKNA